MQCRQATNDLKIRKFTIRFDSAASQPELSQKCSSTRSPFPALLAPAWTREHDWANFCPLSFFPTRTTEENQARLWCLSRAAGLDEAAGNPPIAGQRALHFQGGLGVVGDVVTASMSALMRLANLRLDEVSFFGDQALHFYVQHIVYV